MKFKTILAAVSFLAMGCSDNKPASDAGLVEADASVTERELTRFSLDYEEWRVPESGDVAGFHTDSYSGGRAHWKTIDMDGDKVLDLVQTGDLGSQDATVWQDEDGAYWKVFLGEVGGFSTSAQKMRVPPKASARGYYTAHLERGWGLHDLDHDGRKDFIVFVDPETNKVWEDADGNLAWQMFKGTANGFADMVLWQIPQTNVPMNDTKHCSAIGCWRVFDLTGNGLDDLVHTSDPAPLKAFDAPSNGNWHIYANNGFGFDQTFSRWTVPSIERDEGFFASDWPGISTTRDVDGDGLLELVQAQAYPAGGLFYEANKAYWKVFRRSAAGFEQTATSFSLPRTGLPHGLTFLFLDLGAFQWDTVDLNSDGHLDLLLTANYSSSPPAIWGAPNSDQWKVYLGTEEGFSDSAQTWPLPDMGTEEGFYATKETAAWNRWKLRDLDGDGALELVQTADPLSGLVWRTEDDEPYWRVYRVIP